MAKKPAKKRKKVAKRPVKKKVAKKTGRPRIKLTDEQLGLIDKLSAMQCTDEEVASVLGISVDTLTRRFAERIKSGKEKGRASLRRVQWAAAQAGNATMQIWLGKQVLGQRDKVEQTSTVQVTGVRWNVVDP